MLPNDDALPGDQFISALTEHQAALRGYCQAALGSGEEAKEALQRTNIVLWKKASDWDANTPFLRWALRVARFEVLATIRDKQRERLVFDADVVELMADDTVIEAETQPARREALEHCLSRLKAEHRELLSAHYALGKSVREIAELRGQGLSAIKGMMLRLRRTLAGCIERRLAAEETA
jgi:RNA polymerase sigma-70 factor (ECF subfamily)